MRRAEFEAFISGPPFERDVRRFPQDEARFAWPGSYRDLEVDLAWQAWCESARLEAAAHWPAPAGSIPPEG